MVEGNQQLEKRDRVPNVWQVEDIVFAVQCCGSREGGAALYGSVQCRHVRRGKTSDVKFASAMYWCCYITVGGVGCPPPV